MLEYYAFDVEELKREVEEVLGEERKELNKEQGDKLK